MLRHLFFSTGCAQLFNPAFPRSAFQLENSKWIKCVTYVSIILFYDVTIVCAVSTLSLLHLCVSKIYDGKYSLNFSLWFLLFFFSWVDVLGNSLISHLIIFHFKIYKQEEKHRKNYMLKYFSSSVWFENTWNFPFLLNSFLCLCEFTYFALFFILVFRTYKTRVKKKKLGLNYWLLYFLILSSLLKYINIIKSESSELLRIAPPSSSAAALLISSLLRHKLTFRFFNCFTVSSLPPSSLFHIPFSVFPSCSII